MTAQLVALYRRPADTRAFDDYYFDAHVPLAKKIPGLRAYRVSRGPVMMAGGESPYHLVAMLEFDSAADVQAAFGSPEGQAAAADFGRFAQAGVDLLFFDTRTV